MTIFYFRSKGPAELQHRRVVASQDHLTRRGSSAPPTDTTLVVRTEDELRMSSIVAQSDQKSKAQIELVGYRKSGRHCYAVFTRCWNYPPDGPKLVRPLIVCRCVGRWVRADTTTECRTILQKVWLCVGSCVQL